MKLLKKDVEKVDTIKYKRFQDAISSNKLFRYNEYKMLLPDWKNIGIWFFDKKGVTDPSKYNTKDSIIKRLSECKIP